MGADESSVGYRYDTPGCPTVCSGRSTVALLPLRLNFAIPLPKRGVLGSCDRYTVNRYASS